MLPQDGTELQKFCLPHQGKTLHLLAFADSFTYAWKYETIIVVHPLKLRWDKCWILFCPSSRVVCLLCSLKRLGFVIFKDQSRLAQIANNSSPLQHCFYTLTPVLFQLFCAATLEKLLNNYNKIFFRFC